MLVFLLILGFWWHPADESQDVVLSSAHETLPLPYAVSDDQEPSPEPIHSPLPQDPTGDTNVADTGSAEKITDAIMAFVDLEPGRIGPQQARDWVDRIKESGSVERDGLFSAIRSNNIDAQLLGVYLWFEHFGYTEDLRDAVLQADLNVPVVSEVLYQLFVREDFDGWEALVAECAAQVQAGELFDYLMGKDTPAETLPAGQAAESLQLGNGAGLFLHEMARENAEFRRLLQAQVDSNSDLPLSKRTDWMSLLFKANSLEARHLAKRIMADPAQDDLMYFAALRELIKVGEDPDAVFALLPRDHPFRHRFRRVATRFEREESGPPEIEIRHALGDLNHEPNPQLAYMIASSLSNDQLAKLSSRDLRNVRENLAELPVHQDYLRARINYVLREKSE